MVMQLMQRHVHPVDNIEAVLDAMPPFMPFEIMAEHVNSTIHRAMVRTIEGVGGDIAAATLASGPLTPLLAANHSGQ